MADIIADIPINSTDFTDLFNASGIAVGSPLIVQNKSTNNIVLAISSSKPSASLGTGVVLKPAEYIKLSVGESGLWAICAERDGLVVVQDATLS